MNIKITKENYSTLILSWFNGKNLDKGGIYYNSFISENDIYTYAYAIGVRIKITSLDGPYKKIEFIEILENLEEF